MGLRTTVTFDASKFKDASRAVVSAREPLLEFRDDYAARVHDAWEEMTFSRLNTGSVPFRGEVQWAATKDQYTRKTDGVTVPPWGNVPKLRGPGTVLGRKRRPSQQRVKPSHVVGVDTDKMRDGFFSNVQFTDGGNTMTLKADVKYAIYQNQRRPFAFFTEIDMRRMNAIIAIWFRRVFA